MSSIRSVQNLHTFLRRKNFRPPGPPPSRGGPPGPRPPPNRGRSPPGRSPPGRPSDRGRSLGAAAAATCSGAFVSSAITLLEIPWPVISCQWPEKHRGSTLVTGHWPLTTAFTPLPALRPPEQPPLQPAPLPVARSLSCARRAAP